MAESAQFLQTVEAVYAASTAPDLWPRALVSVSRLFGGVATTLEVFSKQPFTLKEFHVAGLPSRAEIAYLDHYAMHNPRVTFALTHLSMPVLWDAEILDERTMDRDPYYAKYLTSIDLRYFISGQIADDHDTHAAITVQRTARQGHIEPRHIASMRRLIPHIRRAFDVQKRLRAAGERDEGFSGRSTGSPTACFFCVPTAAWFTPTMPSARWRRPATAFA